MNDPSAPRRHRLEVRLAVSLVVGLLWIGPYVESVGVVIRDDPFDWLGALARGLLAAVLIACVQVARRRSRSRDAGSSGVHGAVSDGRLPTTADAQTWLPALDDARTAAGRARIAVGLCLVAIAAFTGVAAVRADEPLLWITTATALGAVPAAAVVLGRRRRTAERLMAERDGSATASPG